jgi:hypothetical protein
MFIFLECALMCAVSGVKFCAGRAIDGSSLMSEEGDEGNDESRIIYC